MSAHFRERKLLPDVPPSSQALLRPQAGPQTGAWLAAIPPKSATTLPPMAMQIALRRSLRQPLPLHSNTCGLVHGCPGAVDRFGDHALACPRLWRVAQEVGSEGQVVPQQWLATPPPRMEQQKKKKSHRLATPCSREEQKKKSHRLATPCSREEQFKKKKQKLKHAHMHTHMFTSVRSWMLLHSWGDPLYSWRVIPSVLDVERRFAPGCFCIAGGTLLLEGVSPLSSVQYLAYMAPLAADETPRVPWWYSSRWRSDRPGPASLWC